MLSRIFVRRMSAVTSQQSMGVFPANPRYKKIQEIQNFFCHDDGLLVWQKCGTRDKMMYYFTMGITVFGFIPSLGTILKMSLPANLR